jgi:exosome complex exonuclease DIS3/RRP44
MNQNGIESVICADEDMPVLLPAQAPVHPLYPIGHYIVPDTNILLHCVCPLIGTLMQMDILETCSFTGIILLQTVLDELRNRSLPLYNRLRTMSKQEQKGMYLFHNDFRAETYVTRNKGETINDRNDRGIFPNKTNKAIREAAKWYKTHLTATLRASRTRVPEIVLLSNDQGNLQKAKEQGITSISS